VLYVLSILHFYLGQNLLHIRAEVCFTKPMRFRHIDEVLFMRISVCTSIITIINPCPTLSPQDLMYFFKPLSLSFASSSTLSFLQTANRSQSSARCAFASVKNSVGGIAATPSSARTNQQSLKSRGRDAT